MNVTRCLALVFLAVHGASGREPRTTVHTASGVIEGVAHPGHEVVAFKGIPFAAPPVGELRWREPQSAIPWEGVRTADTFGASCPQPPSPSGKQPAHMSEDCLFLNVWTPAQTAHDRHAVLFYIHGGAGVWGSGNVEAAALAKKGLVVVTANYRLGLFAGFGHPELTAESPHHTSGTYGLLDLIAALRWVQQNIASFGGDPARVTIAGQSSGANAVHYLLTSPVATGLFHRAIAMSFPFDYLTKPHTIPFVRQKEADGVTFAKLRGAASIADLRRVPAMEIALAGPTLHSAKLYHLGSGAARDGWAFPATYGEALDRGLASDVPTLTGITADDFGPPAAAMTTTMATFTNELLRQFGEKKAVFAGLLPAFLALGPVTTDQQARETVKRAQLEYRRCSTHFWAARRAKTAKTPVYTYLFDHVVWPEKGAPHSADLPYVFGDPNGLDRPWTADDQRVADQVGAYWANFVKTGNPNGDGLAVWPPFEATRPETMVLRSISAPQSICAPQRLPFYRQLLE
jgi:para-nitrobenzyl esterase